jgi:hypothetical protein
MGGHECTKLRIVYFWKITFLKKKNVFLFRPLFVLGKLNRAQTEI